MNPGMSYTRHRTEVFYLFARRKNNSQEVVSGDCLENNEETRVKWERNLKFKKTCKYFKRKNFKNGSASLTCTILLPTFLLLQKSDGI